MDEEGGAHPKRSGGRAGVQILSECECCPGALRRELSSLFFEAHHPHRVKHGDDAGDVEAHRTPLRSHACRVRNTNEHDDIQFFQHIDVLNKSRPRGAPYMYFNSVV
jgi:hypothetical protein